MLTIYKASAGSGKTYTLAKTYISLLLWRPSRHNPEMLEINLDNEQQKHEPNRHRAILAITFTRKATQEMKRRILEELNHLAKVTPTNAQQISYARDFMKEYGCTAQQLASASTLALQELLFDYQNFNVSTIDAFFQRVLQAFARELDMQADYKVELNDESSMQSAVGIMLDHFNISPKDSTSLEGWLYSMMRDFVASGKKANFFNRKSQIFGRLVSLISQISKETFKQFRDDMLEYLKTDQLDKFSKEIDTAIEKANSSVKAIAHEALIDSGFNLDGMSKRSIVLRICKDLLIGKMPSSEDWAKEKVIALLNNETTEGIFNKGYGTAAEWELLKQLFYDICHVAANINDLQIVKSSIIQLGLLKYAWDVLLKQNQENNTLLMSDTNMLVSKVIDEDEAPFVYEKMGVKLKHFLIDEFQDTSQMQWQNLKPLVANGQSMGGQSLIIGDEKQSIYRFRNSDSSILRTQVKDDFTDPVTMMPKIHLEIKGNNPGENTNHRSSETIVRFNNTFFATLAARTKTPGFDNVMQQVREEYKNYKGYVTINFETGNLIETLDSESQNEKERLPLDDKKEPVYDEMAREILRQHNQGGYPWKDIAILLNTNNEAADVINFLARHYPEIAVMSDDALKISFSPAVQLIISLLSLIDQEESDPAPEEETSNKYLSRRQIQGIINRFELHYSQGMKEYGLELPDEETRRRLSEKALQQALSDANSTKTELYQHINAIRAVKPTTLVALVETILEAQFSAAERNSQLAYIMAFQDVVIQFCEEQDGSLHAFLEWWKANSHKQHVQGAAESNAVKVMTLHSSKGLEFHCVHIPLCTWPMLWQPNKAQHLWIPYPESLKSLTASQCPPAIYLKIDSSTEFPKSQFKAAALEEKKKATIDTINKTYVAFTRARSELMVWCTNSSRNCTTIDEEIYDLLSRYCHNGKHNDISMDLSEYWDEQKKQFKVGNPTKFAESDPKRAAKMLNAEKSEQSPQDLYPVKYRSDAAALLKLDDLLELDTDIDDNTAAASTLTDDYQKEDEEIRVEGLLMHEMMSHIITKDDVDTAISNVSQYRRLDDSQMEKCTKIVRGFVHNQIVEKLGWYNGSCQVLVEQPIYIPSEGYTRRPDRIMIDSQGGVTVIDYKFVSDPSRYKATDHIAQLQEYMGLLRDMGYQPVSGYLCYPRLKKIAKVSMK